MTRVFGLDSEEVCNYKKNLETLNNKIDYIYNKNLRKYQNEGISFINRRDRVGVFDEQRLGKTPTTLISLKYKKIEHSIIIIAPKSTLLSWEQECEVWLTGVNVCRIDATKHSKQKRKELYKSKYKIYIMNYNIVASDKDILPKCDCVVIDEAHRLRNFKGMRSKNSPEFTKAIIKLALDAKFAYTLTGTPAPNYSYNIYPLLHILLPEVFTSYYYFIDYYYHTIEQHISRNETIVKPTKMKENKEEELKQILSLVAIQRKRKDYMEWIPDVDHKKIYLEMDKQEQIWYNKLYETFELEEFNINCQNKLSLLVKLRQFTSSISKQKTNFILDYIKDYPEEQIIIASTFTSYLKELHKLIPESKLCIGDSNDTKRKQLETEFNNKKFKILLANIEVIKEGTKYEQCNTMIITDPTLVYTDNEQLKDRLIPTRQEIAEKKEKQQIIYLITKYTIDEWVQEQLDSKKSSSEIINNFNKIRGT